MGVTEYKIIPSDAIAAGWTLFGKKTTSGLILMMGGE
jgi:hypothetical protein